MKPNQPQSLRRFLAAHQLGREAESEQALAELMRSRPRPAPSADFSARVMARAVALGLVPPAESPSLRWLRGFSAAALGISALLVVLVGAQLRRPELALWRELTWSEFWVYTLGALGRLVAGAAALWQNLLEIGETVSLSLQTPGTALTLTFALSLSVLAFRVLHELISRDRSSFHVHSR